MINKKKRWLITNAFFINRANNGLKSTNGSFAAEEGGDECSK
jgi:hypothetical protein